MHGNIQGLPQHWLKSTALAREHWLKDLQSATPLASGHSTPGLTSQRTCTASVDMRSFRPPTSPETLASSSARYCDAAAALFRSVAACSYAHTSSAYRRMGKSGIGLQAAQNSETCLGPKGANLHILAEYLYILDIDTY